jgi:TIR domain-containing protein
MSRICLSYRRLDSTAIVGRIYDRLVSRYGAESVFMDVSDIPYGADFREHIQGVFSGTNLLIAVIGHRWLGQQAQGAPRIRQRSDPVRVEIHTALAQRIRVIPVLIDGASMPAADELPRSIRDFAFRNAIRVDSGVDFNIHIERLMAQVNEELGIEQGGASATPAADAWSPKPNAPAVAAEPPTGLSQVMALAFRLLPYFVSPIVLLLLAHYLIVMKLDISPIYLRAVAVVIPLICGFLLFRWTGLGVGAATLLGLGMSLVAVTGMLTVVGFVDSHAILPASVPEWQEAFEYVVTITLATAAGSLLGRVARSTALGRSEAL